MDIKTLVVGQVVYRPLFGYPVAEALEEGTVSFIFDDLNACITVETSHGKTRTERASLWYESKKEAYMAYLEACHEDIKKAEERISYGQIWLDSRGVKLSAAIKYYQEVIINGNP